jgi:hypothetical protein
MQGGGTQKDGGQAWNVWVGCGNWPGRMPLMYRLELRASGKA